jgi:hypothetical protein
LSLVVGVEQIVKVLEVMLLEVEVVLVVSVLAQGFR